TKYRVVVTDQNYHEKLALNLTKTRLWATLGFFALAVMVLTVCLIVFTPLRQFVPGYTREELMHEAYGNRLKLDSLQGCVEGQAVMLQLMQAAIAGQMSVEQATVRKDSLKDYSHVEYRRGLADSLLRKEVESADPYVVKAMSAAGDHQSLADHWLFYAPVSSGQVLHAFDARSFTGVEVETRPNESVMATMGGYVVYADWSPENGYVLVLQHGNHLISIYARNSAVLKMPGEYVEAGEVVAMTGTSLHFELWYNGFPMNPQNYVTF
ncbi:MAG: M23 family metallopeptidase, partial [Bacteroidales bacterium]|nr:M23 family metallopeptidase [Bacteroidales bacterium]